MFLECLMCFVFGFLLGWILSLFVIMLGESHEKD